jgi:peptide/nickel transport system permease protein
VLTFIGRRLLGAIPVLFVTTLVSFSMVHLIPGDAAVVAAGENATLEQIEEVRRRLGLDKPLVEQYLSWVGGMLQGDFGTSLFSSYKNSEALKNALPVTLSLTVLALLWSLLLGVGAGSYAGLRKGRWQDRTVTAISTLGISLPSFWIGILLVSLFGISLRWFPVGGYVPLLDDPVAWLRHLFLPSLALGVATSAELTRQARASTIDVIEQDYIRTATAKGLSPAQVTFKHTSKNAAIPIVTVFGSQAAHLIGGSIIIEQVFRLPGLGSLAVRSVVAQDFPVIQALVVVVTVFVLLINLLVDMSYGYFNPKARVR